jgi:hypothetical protein
LAIGRGEKREQKIEFFAFLDPQWLAGLRVHAKVRSSESTHNAKQLTLRNVHLLGLWPASAIGQLER